MYQGSGYFRLPVGLRELSRAHPDAVAKIAGSEEYSEFGGRVWFFGQEDGVLVVSELWGLPVWEGACGSSVFGFHIHEGSVCVPTDEEAFEGADGHYNPNGCEHPMHAGNLPPLFGNGGLRAVGGADGSVYGSGGDRTDGDRSRYVRRSGYPIFGKRGGKDRLRRNFEIRKVENGGRIFAEVLPFFVKKAKESLKNAKKEKVCFFLKKNCQKKVYFDF